MFYYYLNIIIWQVVASMKKILKHTINWPEVLINEYQDLVELRSRVS